MLPKIGKYIRLTKNNRPITLHNTIARVLESLLLDNLNVLVTPKIRPEQYGFKATDFSQ